MRYEIEVKEAGGGWGWIVFIGICTALIMWAGK